MRVNPNDAHPRVQSMLPLKTLPFVERGRNFCERFESVTILVSDIVSFTNIAAEMDPLEVVNMLNELYRMYDQLVDTHCVYKVETIGDAFMCAGGVRPTHPAGARHRPLGGTPHSMVQFSAGIPLLGPGKGCIHYTNADADPSEFRHFCRAQVPNAMTPEAGACAAADMGLDMIESTRRFVTSAGQVLQIRVGLHSGPVVAAVIGLKMPHYCLFGDTVNTASRMESNSEAMRIHISADTFHLLQVRRVVGWIIALPSFTEEG